MTHIQKQFIQFDESIRLGRFEEKKDLREKRDRVLTRLADGLRRQRENGVPIPEWRTFHQGSYRLGTGVLPLDGDYDIDIGLEFDLQPDGHDSVAVKEWVFNAVEKHTKRVEVRRPCVTVWYQAQGEPIYHVDLAVYASPSFSGAMFLARGKQNSSADVRIWERSEPREFVSLIEGRFSGEDGAQFRRVIRALKRWKDVQFSSESNGSPNGIGLTVAAYKWFQSMTVVDAVAGIRKPDDLAAVLAFVTSMLGSFRTTMSEGGGFVERLSVPLPVQPFTELFEQMTDSQMTAFKAKLTALEGALKAASGDPDPHSASITLRSKFGDDFPVPPKEDTAKAVPRAIVSSGNSA